MAVPYSSNFDRTHPFSDIVAQVALGVGVEQTFTVPGPVTARYTVSFTYTSTSNVFICLGATPVVPGAASVGTQAYNEYRPGEEGSRRYVNGGQVIHLITPDATAYVGITLMQLP
jgi:hypothetical protein